MNKSRKEKHEENIEVIDKIFAFTKLTKVNLCITMRVSCAEMPIGQIELDGSDSQFVYQIIKRLSEKRLEPDKLKPLNFKELGIPDQDGCLLSDST